MSFFKDVWDSTRKFIGASAGAAGTVLGGAIGSAIPVVGNTIGASAGGLLGSAFGKLVYDTDKKSTEQAIAQQEREYQHQIDLYNMNNEYNSPANQLQRLKDAGLSSSALFSSIGNTSSAPATSSTSSIASALLTNDLQHENMKAQTELLRAQATGQHLTNSYDALSIPERLANLRKQNNKLDAEAIKILNDIDIAKGDFEIRQKTYDWFAHKSEVELQQMYEQLNILRNEVISSSKQNELLDVNIENAKKQGDYIESQTTSQKISNDFESRRLQFSNFTGVPQNTPLEQVLFGLWEQGKFQDMGQLVASYAIARAPEFAGKVFESVSGKVGNILGKIFK